MGIKLDSLVTCIDCARAMVEREGNIANVACASDEAKHRALFGAYGKNCAGDYSYSGQYDENTVGSSWHRTDTQVRLYAYANSACAQAELLKEKDIGVYTIGLFQTMEQMPEEGQDVVSFFN